jgi:hypothetical protein
MSFDNYIHTLKNTEMFYNFVEFVVVGKCTYLWFVPAGNTLTALMSNCN